jgi:YD repeat-containing protein
MKSARPFLTLVVLLVATASFGQQSFMDEPGIPAFTTAFPVEHGFINLANGNLHIEIPIATYPQRGNIKALHARLVYDSRFWTIRTDPVTLAQSWTQSLPLVGVSVGGGFRLITDGEAGNADSDRGVSVQCGCESFGTGCTPRFKTTYSKYFYQEPNGTTHRLPNTFKLINKYPSCVGPASNPDGTAYAMDNSGYKFVVINYTHMTVYAPDGSQVFPVLQDTNGNFYSTSAGQNSFTDVVDTLGRTPVVTTFSGNQTFVDYLCPAGCNPANGDRARVTITSSASASSCTTQFNQASVNETTVACGGSQSIVLPDGSSYQLEFDSYGQITSITLPTGGQITYGYSNFTEPLGNVNRWVTSMVRDGQSWSFTPVNQACSVPPCTIQVTVTTPPYTDGTTTASDNRVYLFTVTGGYGGGAWNTQTQYFRGALGGDPSSHQNNRLRLSRHVPLFGRYRHNPSGDP